MTDNFRLKGGNVNIRPGFLVATICLSLFGATYLPSIGGQTSRKPAETVQKLFEMMGKGETEGIEKLFLLPGGTSDPDINDFIHDFKMSLADAAQDFKRRGGIKSLTILKQESVGGRAEVEYEFTRADGTTATDKLELIYDHDEWKIDLTKQLTISRQAAHEVAALSLVQDIGKAQILYSVTKGRGKFTDLMTLGKEGLVDSELASGEKLGYLFTSKPILIKNGPPMFDTTAKPKSTGTSGTGNRSFYSNETMIVYEANGGKPPRATASDRVPKNGAPIR